MWFSYHTHSTYCDGKSSVKEIVDKARGFGLHSVGISSHAPLPFEKPWCMKLDQLPEYLTEIQNQKTTDIEVYSGLEVDYIPEKIGPKEFQAKLDYTIGSIHFVDAFKNGQGWEIDGSHQLFLEGLSQIFQGNFKEAASRYFELTRQMLEESAPNIVGHLDKIKIQNLNHKFFRESDAWYKSEIIKTLDCIKKAGSILEVNTRGLYQKKSETVYPSPWVLELVLQKKIPITLSSDAHHHKDLVNHFESTAASLYEIGFREISILKKGFWVQTKFNSNGISI